MSGQASSQLERSPGFDGESISEEEVERIKQAETEHRIKPVQGEVPAELSLDKKFELLKNQRRRWVLKFLLQNGEASTTGELAEHVAVLENDKEHVNGLTSQERKAAYVGLYQCHLPKMDDYGVIRFNQARGRIELTEQAYQLEEYLERETERPWSLLYLGLAASGGALYAVTSLAGVVSLPSVVAGVTLFAVGLTAAVQWWQQTEGR